MKLVAGFTEYTTTIHGQENVKDAVDVARRRAELDGWHVRGVGSYLPHRGSIPGSWVVSMKVEKKP